MAKPKAAPAKALLQDETPAARLSRLVASRARAAEELASLRRDEDAAFDRALDDPEADLGKVDASNERIRKLADYLQRIESRIEEAREAAQAQVLIDAERASAADRLHAIRLSEAKAEIHGPAVDAAAAILIERLNRFLDAGNACDTLTRKGLAARYRGDHMLRLGDTLTLALPRASGRSANVACAIAQLIKRLVDLVGSNELSRWVQVDPHMPHAPATVAKAAAMDHELLRGWLADKPVAPVPALQQANEVPA